MPGRKISAKLEEFVSYSPHSLTVTLEVNNEKETLYLWKLKKKKHILTCASKEKIKLGISKYLELSDHENTHHNWWDIES